MKLANLIKTHRGNKGWSLRDVVANSEGGITLGGLHDLETGRTVDPHVSNLLGAAKGLKLKPEVLLASVKESLESKS